MDLIRTTDSMSAESKEDLYLKSIKWHALKVKIKIMTIVSTSSKHVKVM